MRRVRVGNVSYTIHAVWRNEAWIAFTRADTGERFGIQSTGSTEGQAIDSMIAWLEWQHDHAAAFSSLQIAERAYHRMVAGNAFSSNDAADAGSADSRETLDNVEAARARLDEIRARKPEGV
jgi:hypothetical protein